MHIIILGAGRVGSAMALDLAMDREYKISVLDKNLNFLNLLEKIENIKTLQLDLSDADKLNKSIVNADLVIDALPGFLGFETFKRVIAAGVDVVDIAFFAEDPFQLDTLAKNKNVTAVMDCGVAPGMSNILIGHVNELLDKITNAVIYVGGLPAIREWPYEYKAVFSPIDVIEEYTRPARYVENGQIVTREALSDPELLNFQGVGTLEAFNTDGLRTLIKTINSPNMKEKTLRYPGHIEKMAILRETGFFSTEPIKIKGVDLRPIDFTSKLLFPKWELEQGEGDITVMKVIVEGEKEGKNIRYSYDLLDRFDQETQITSMARTTGYTATMAARMITHGIYKETGVSPPEFMGRKKECVQFMLQGLEERGIIYKEKIEGVS